jgi:hypothetical protein
MPAPTPATDALATDPLDPCEAFVRVPVERGWTAVNARWITPFFRAAPAGFRHHFGIRRTWRALRFAFAAKGR